MKSGSVHLQPISLLNQAIGKAVCQFHSLVFVEPMLRDQSRQERTIHAASQIMPPGNGKKSAGIVVESYRVIEPSRLGDPLAETHHSFRAVVKPPRRPQTQARIMPGQRSQLPAVGRFI